MEIQKNDIKNNLEPIDVLGSDISKLYIFYAGIKEIIYQSNIKFEVYCEHYDFFYNTYVSFYNEIYHGIYRLCDNDQKVLSIVNLLKNIDDELLKKINENPIRIKMEKIRHNFLGHKNYKLNINVSEYNKFYNANKIILEEVEKYLELIVLAWEKSSNLTFQKPATKITSNINSIFENLAKNKEN